jgi:photosystem II stability/assembly factor-like uncharacterized protein
MRRLLLALALAALVAVVAIGPVGSATGSLPHGFHPDTAAAYGTRDIWLLGGTTLLRSTDAGRHFTKARLPQHLWSGRGTVPSLVFANARDGYVYSYASGWLFSSHDGGQSWHRSYPGNELGFTVGGGHVFVFMRGSRGLERSLVSRDSWRLVKPLKTVYPIGLAARGSRVWLLGPPWRRPQYSDTIRLSDNHGRTFAKRTGPCEAQFDGRLASVGRGVVWAVCPTGMLAGLWVSTNNGHSFSSRSFHEQGGHGLPILTNAAWVAPASSRVAVLSSGGGGALLRTTDTGHHWSHVPGTAGIQQVFWLGFANARVGAAVVETRGGGSSLWRTTDAGASWHVVPIL